METSDEELEWRERVYNAQKKRDAQWQKLKRPFIEGLLSLIVETTWQFSTCIILFSSATYLFIALLLRDINWLRNSIAISGQF